MINLNSSDFNLNKEFPTPEKILQYVTDFDIFSAYIENLSLGKAINSPIRRESHPSFSVYYSQKYNKLLFKDLATGVKGDVFEFLKLKFPALTFNQILQDIVWAFGLDDKFVCNYKISGHKRNITRTLDYDYKSQEVKRLKVKTRRWQEHDVAYWGSYGVSGFTLEKFKVKPVEFIFIENLSKGTESVIKADRYSYGYYENKDFVTFKVYQPYSKNMKFLSSHDSTVHSGYVQLPGVGEILLITKSLKDVMAITENSLYSAVAVQSETTYMKEKVMNEYKSRFQKVITLFDNDQTGINLGIQYRERYGIPAIRIPEHKKYPIKDYSDVIKFVNRPTASLLLNNLIKELP